MLPPRVNTVAEPNPEMIRPLLHSLDPTPFVFMLNCRVRARLFASLVPTRVGGARAGAGARAPLPVAGLVRPRATGCRAALLWAVAASSALHQLPGSPAH